MSKKKIIIISITVVCLALTTFLILKQYKTHTTHNHEKTVYICPMNCIPGYTLDHPGNCPKCGMNLVPKKVETEKSGEQLYHCPMHPTYTSKKPGSCPICGMNLVPVKQDEHTNAKSGVYGQASVEISTDKEQLVGVKTERIIKRNLIHTIRATGRVAHDPELYNAIVEYQNSLSNLDSLKSLNISSSTVNKTETIVNSGYVKLKHMGLSDEQIRNITKDAKYPTSLIMVTEPGGTVWVYLQIYEFETGLVKPGQDVEMTATAFPDKIFSGTIKSVDSYLDHETRTLRVRTEVPNPEGLLKPEMFVNATLRINLGYKTAIPENSVLDSGTRKIVFIKTGEGKYSPREIVLGYEADGYYEIIKGVAAGEEIVTSANFLIDSESKLKSAISGMAEHKH